MSTDSTLTLSGCYSGSMSPAPAIKRDTRFAGSDTVSVYWAENDHYQVRISKEWYENRNGTRKATWAITVRVKEYLPTLEMWTAAGVSSIPTVDAEKLAEAKEIVRRFFAAAADKQPQYADGVTRIMRDVQSAIIDEDIEAIKASPEYIRNMEIHAANAAYLASKAASA